MARVATFKEKLKEYFDMNKKSKIRKFVDKLSDNTWITELAYINYIFSRLNAINKSLQGHLTTVIVDKLRADKILVSNG